MAIPHEDSEDVSVHDISNAVLIEDEVSNFSDCNMCINDIFPNMEIGNVETNISDNNDQEYYELDIL